MVLEKRLFTSFSSLKLYLTNKGFTINSSNGQMRWGAANANSLCHWQFDNTNEELNFVDSLGNEAFPFSLCDFSSGRITGVAFIELEDGGCAINVTPLNEGSSTSDFTLSCALGYDPDYSMNTSLPQNGLVVCTPEEDDGYWRYGWREKPDRVQNGGNYYFKTPSFSWVIDNCRNIVTSGKEISTVSRWEVSQTISIAKVYLADGYWSNYIYNQILGTNQAPGQVFELNGKKFISFCPEDLTEVKDSESSSYTSYPRRCPCFILEGETVLINDSSSTQEYSNRTIYHAGDYCIYRSLLYKCLIDILTPEPWDSTHWELTTVPNELSEE